MIQKLLGGERKICISSEGFLQTTLSPCPSSTPPSSSAATSTTTATVTASPNPEAQSLRCPRCDSTNTKFCYYNNYNLTQPRHFCKTCRRYWTKGGALRNVPIGGGCRKNKTATNISISSGKSSASAKLKSSFSISEIGKQIFLDSGFDHELVWPPQSSHVLALLRTGQSPSSIQLGPMNGAQFSADPGGVASTLGMRSLSLDSYSTNQLPSVDASGALWRSNQQPKDLATGGEAQNSGIQELLQRLKTSTSTYYGNHQPAVLSSNTFLSSSTNGSGILESAPVTGGDFGYFNLPFSWPDVATQSGAYP